MNLPQLEIIPSNRGIHRTDIEWADYAVGSPFIFRHKVTGQVIPNACVKVSSGCANCYAEQIGLRFKKGLAYTPKEMANLEVHLDRGVIDSILRFRPSPAKGATTYKNGRSRPAVFLGDMTDIFGEWVPFRLLHPVYAAMALRLDVDFLLLTKRPETMAEVHNTPTLGLQLLDACPDQLRWHELERNLGEAGGDYLSNVWHGCSVENRATLSRIHDLARCPSSTLFVSFEPLLEDLGDIGPYLDKLVHAVGVHPKRVWAIIGGESGKGARPYNLAWPRSIIEQCAAACVPCFHKQVGSYPVYTTMKHYGGRKELLMHNGERLRDSKGGDPSEWPHDLRVRQMPRGGK